MRAYQNAAAILLRQASRIVLQNMDRVDRVKVSKNQAGLNENSLVSALEETIIARLQELYPSHNVLSRYSGLSQRQTSETDEDFTWVLDPLDGIDNFMSCIPNYTISLALFDGRQCVLGLIYHPISDQLYSAIHEHGAFLDGKKISAMKHHREQQPLIALSGDTSLEEMTSHVSKISRYPLGFNQVRNLGSVSLSLALQASGSFELFYARSVHFCSAAAGILLASEARANVKQEKESDLLFSKLVCSSASLKK